MKTQTPEDVRSELLRTFVDAMAEDDFGWQSRWERLATSGVSPGAENAVLAGYYSSMLMQLCRALGHRRVSVLTAALADIDARIGEIATREGSWEG